MYQALLRQGKDEGTAARIAQAQTGLSLQTGMKPKSDGAGVSKSLFVTSSVRFQKQLNKAFDESKIKRDEKGRFSSTGAAAGVAAAGLGLAGAAAAGLPGARAILPGLRRAVLGARHRLAREDIRGIARLASASGSGDSTRTLRAVLGALGVKGREKPAVNALRQMRGQFSQASRRRRARHQQQQMPSWW